ncbi:fluoride efflux transporter CrcB [Undibacterium macrobrachii]|jgi:CrcB protein|uniref:Fluoride-specific ion channel FluC n=1 Tax=Undibacterium macrobrachii TaxID=1119058 RepID=A0ABQ2X917_9BURK|nr:fluoride efflux transporter CrcB [Undibacterium macrobrachii]GGX04739.1 putative fluoride ion transporter CrcB [Undibacterium macrobrachii]
MNGLSVIAVSAGAAIGACLRWVLSLTLNSVHVNLPLGTLFANLGGAYVIGICVGFFSANPQLSPEWRLFVVTGFLGGLTTFSSFSAEAMELLQKGEWLWAFGHSTLHLLGSILCCFAGYASWRLFQSV